MKNLHIQYKRDTGEDVPDMMYQDQKDYLAWLEETAEEAVKLLREFTDRKEKGEAGSSYLQFKRFLDAKD